MADTEPPSLEPMLRKLLGHGKLNAAERTATLALPHTIRTFGAHEYVVRQGDVARYCCVLLSGFCVRQKVVGRGARQIVALHLNGDLVDLQNSLLGVADHNLQALTVVRFAMVPRDMIMRMMDEYPVVAMRMWQDTLVDASVGREWMANIGRRDAAGRVAHLLCELGLRFQKAGLGSAEAFEMPLTQEQIGDVTGLTSVHVNRMLKAFERDGIIRRSRKTVHIDDWGQLASIGDFDDQYLHLNEDKLALS